MRLPFRGRHPRKIRLVVSRTSDEEEPRQYPALVLHGVFFVDIRELSTRSASQK